MFQPTSMPEQQAQKGKQYAQTKPLKEALALARRISQAEDAAIGEITGETGTGKSAAGKHIAATLGDAYRVACYQGISPAKLNKELLRAVFQNEPSRSSLEDRLRQHAEGKDRRPLLVVDECNKARWPVLESLRHLSDELGWAVLLIGTELYAQQYRDARTAPLLHQLNRRIGGKRVEFAKLGKEDFHMHVLYPRFGAVQDAELLVSAWKGSGKGNWGLAMELGDCCQRVMEANGKAALDRDVLGAALSYMPQPEGAP